MIAGALTQVLLHSMCHLKATQMNVQCSLIQEFILYLFKLGYNTLEATENICCAKGEGTVNHSTVTRWFQNFCLEDLVESCRPETMDSKAMLQAIDANPASNTQNVSLGLEDFVGVICFIWLVVGGLGF